MILLIRSLVVIIARGSTKFVISLLACVAAAFPYITIIIPK
jgi:acyl-CoA synthetase (AMP-forming)/AMP-acid ligase II